MRYTVVKQFEILGLTADRENMKGIQSESRWFKLMAGIHAFFGGTLSA
jgi:hypothetical protein